MWFKNLNVYRITNLDMTEEELAEHLLNRPFKACGPVDPKAAGWVSPLGDTHESLVHSSLGCHMFCMKFEEKNLPASVLNEKTKERIAELMQKDPEIKKIKRDVKNKIKEQVRQELLPKAFSKYNRIMAYIDTQQQMLIIDSASRTKAEEMIQYLLAGLGDDVKVKPVQAVHEVCKQMSNWLTTGKKPADLEFGEKCQLRDLNDLGTIRYAKHNMEDSKLQKYLEDDKTVAELELSWEDKVRFILAEDLMIKSVKFLDIVQEEAGSQPQEDFIESFDVEFAIMHATVRNLFPYVLTCFGGEHIEE